jgi:gamma-glutamyltranspeptidase / glutathione hydrolase
MLQERRSFVRQFDLPGRSPVFATNGIAATSHPHATNTAMTILRDGGNAVDAAIAASATLAVVEPHMTGIGGDCFAIVCEPDGQIFGLNGSGRSASGVNLEWFIEKGITSIEPGCVHSITVPGAVNAWETLHQRFGSMDFTRLFADAVRYANEGYVVYPRVAHDWAKLTEKLAANPGARKIFLKDSRAPRAGERMTNPSLGNILEAIARHGAAAFYNGPVAREIAETVQNLGGFLSEEDLAGVHADWVEPVSTNFYGHEIYQIPPNSQGVTALVLLELLSKCALASDPAGGERYYMEMELGRIAYAVRNRHIADPDHMRMDVNSLLSESHIAALLKNYDPDQRNPSLVLPKPKGGDTVYLSIVDRDLRCVSFINSIFAGFGSGIVTEQSGIALHNRGSGFVIERGHVNALGPAKRPMHTTMPALATYNGKASICFGVMGGQYQAIGHAHVLTDLLHFGMDPQATLDSARIFWDENGKLLAETGISDSVRTVLRQKGFAVTDGGPHGGGQIVTIDHASGIMCAGSDPRKDGHAAGY